MKSKIFSKKDEVVLSILTALVVGGLFYYGCTSLADNNQHTVFQKSVAHKK
jgi:hypothetical protein